MQRCGAAGAPVFSVISADRAGTPVAMGAVMKKSFLVAPYGLPITLVLAAIGCGGGHSNDEDGGGGGVDGNATVDGSAGSDASDRDVASDTGATEAATSADGGVCGNCDDNNPCTDDTCDPDSHLCVHVDNTAACDDGNACTTNDTCSAGTCVGGAPLSCDDSNVCTTDTCDSVKGCVHTDNSAPCDDGNACTTNDTCAGGTCNGTTVDCDDNNVCTTDTCNTLTGCVHTGLTGTPCDDGNACTVNDTCSSGTCAPGTAKDCNDSNPCTKDSCNTVTGCVHTDDNSMCCAGGYQCASGKCSTTLCL